MITIVDKNRIVYDNRQNSKEALSKLCPHCNQEELEVRYTHALTSIILDGGQPPRMVRELSGLVCHRCQLLWYAMHRETLQASYERICKEEPHP